MAHVGIVVVTGPLGVRAVAVDVNETLFALEPLDERFAAVGLDPALRATWFARTLRDGFALSACGDYRAFPVVAAAALRSVGGELPDDAVASVLAGFRTLEPHPDVEPALKLLREAGIPAVTLSVGGADVAATLLERAGLSGYVRATLSSDDVRRWKPAWEPYAHAATVCGVERAQLALVAAHAWDVHGARRAGLRTGCVSRLEGRFAECFDRADVEGERLDDVVAGLLA